jgi:hypothetical protein
MIEEQQLHAHTACTTIEKTVIHVNDASRAKRLRGILNKDKKYMQAILEPNMML